jgi:hypothetical protein
MNKFSILIIFLIVFLQAICFPAYGQSKQEDRGKDTWQKMKECAEQADRLTKLPGYKDLAWQNHYSPKYGRCYAKAIREMTNSENVKVQFVELVDAFEAKTLAMCSPDYLPKDKQSWCNVQDDTNDILNWVGCDACREYIKDRMNN